MLQIQFLNKANIKGIDRSFELRGEIRLNRFVKTNWRLGIFFYFIFKGTPSQDRQRTNRLRLITFKVTLTESHFLLIFLLRKVTLRGHINSIKWPPPLNQRRGDAISCGWGANSDDWRKSLALCRLCATYKRNTKSANQMNFTVQCTVALTS